MHDSSILINGLCNNYIEDELKEKELKNVVKKKSEEKLKVQETEEETIKRLRLCCS